LRRELADLGAKVYGRPLKTRLKIFETEAEIYVVDGSDDGKSAYDRALIVIEGSPGVPDSARVPAQKISFPLDAFSPWIEVAAKTDRGLEVGWVRGRVELGDPYAHGRRVRFTFTPVYRDMARSTVNFCYPPQFKDTLAAAFERYLPLSSYVIETMPDFVDDARRYLEFFYRYDDWDLFIYQFQVTDAIQHLDGDGPYFREVMRKVDSVIGEVASWLPEGSVLLVVSDHGNRAFRHYVYPNVWLDQLHLIARDPEGNLDMAHSIAFHMYWGIYINRDELERRYRVIPGFHPAGGSSLYEAFRDFLIQEASMLTYPGSDVPMSLRLMKPPPGGVGSPPDLIVYGEYGAYLPIYEDYFRSDRELVRPLILEGKKSYHRRAGMYVVWGEGVRPLGPTRSKFICDVAPTILWLLGLPVAKDFDGKPMRDLFQAQMASAPGPPELGSYRFLRRGRLVGRTEREKVEEKLRAIGYIR